jgi:hypothetical protein
MPEFVHYYGQFNDLRGNFGVLPTWARTVVGIFAVPGMILLGLSILAVVVSLLALLLLTLPIYSLLQRLTWRSPPMESEGVKRVEATIVE